MDFIKKKNDGIWYMSSDEWPEYKLAELCESIDYGYTASASSIPIGTRFLRITDIVPGHISWHEVPYCEIDRKIAGRYKINHGDIVIARTGATTGVSAYISNPPDAVFASYLIRIRIGPKADPRFISYFLKSSNYWSYMRGVLGDKSAQPNANAKTLTRVRLRVPAISEQLAIAHILGTLDDKIELNRRMNETLEAMARALFKSWFVDFDPVRAKVEGRQPEGMDADTAALFPDSFEDSELGEIPVGWNVCTVSSIADLNARTLGGNDHLDIIDYIEIGKVLRGEVFEVARYERGTEPSRAKRRLTHGDTVLSTVRPDRGAYFLCLNPPDTLIASTGFVVATPKNNSWAFLHTALIRPEVGEELGLLADGGAYPAIRPEVIGGLSLVTPRNQQIVDAYERISQPLFEKADRNRKTSLVLATTRDALLPKLISGEVRIKDAEKWLEARR